MKYESIQQRKSNVGIRLQESPMGGVYIQHSMIRDLALAYTIEHNLPPEAIVVSTRVKTLQSFLKKLEGKSWPQFYDPTEVIKDLIGARVVCWFVDDCQGIKELISSSKHLTRTIHESL